MHPGGIKTAIARSARVSDKEDKEATAKLFDEKLAKMTPERAAEIIVRGIVRNQARVLVGIDAHALHNFQKFTGSRYEDIVALVPGVATHLPLREIADAITAERVERVTRILHADLQHKFGIAQPRILVCGLNPHAGEGGHLGHEEIDIIEPTLERLRSEGMDLHGPLPADTLFTPKYLEHCDAVLAMYHDQGLPVLKYKGFGAAVNITLGLPIIRTSVDHGTALDLAGSGKIDTGSLQVALETAYQMAETRI